MHQNDQIDSLLVRALRKERVERPPVWMMRQAGRYLPEYREIRATTDFLTLCRTPDLAAEVTVQPVDIVGVDAAIIFSDILVIPEAMGMLLKMEEGKGGPRFPDPLSSPEQLSRLRTGIAGELQYVYDAIAETKRRLGGRVPVIGFAGAPVTLAAYMIEGAGSKTFNTFKAALFGDRSFVEDLLERLSAEIVEYFDGQVAAGANVLQLFDTWTSIVPEQELNELGFRVANDVITETRRRHPEIPVIYFPKGVRNYAVVAESSADGVGIDWGIDLKRAFALFPHNKTLQGNLDPAVLLTDPETIAQRTAAMLDAVPRGRSYVANLGHGIDKSTPVDNARAFVQAVKERA